MQPPAEAAQLARAPRWDDLANRHLLGGPPENPIQQLIEHQLQRLHRREAPAMQLNYFETQIAMVESGAGSAVLPSFCLPACRGRKVATAELTDPVVPIDLMQMVRRGRDLPGAAEFSAFLASRIAGWIEPWTPGFERAA